MCIRDSIWFDTQTDTAPEVVDYLRKHGDSYDQFKLDGGWAHDTRDRAIFPTSGSLNQLSAQVALPGSTAEFYKLNYRGVAYFPFAPWLTWSLGDVYNRQVLARMPLISGCCCKSRKISSKAKG